MTQADAPSAARSIVEQELFCAGCGYRLKGLDAAGKCPECASSVQDSVRAPLMNSRPRQLRSVAYGAVCIESCAASCVALILLVLLAPTSPLWSWVLREPVRWTWFLCMAAGVWLLTCRLPALGSPLRGQMLAWAIRGASLVYLGLVLIHWTLWWSITSGWSYSWTSGQLTVPAVGTAIKVMPFLMASANGAWFLLMGLYLYWLRTRTLSGHKLLWDRLFVWVGPPLAAVGPLHPYAPLFTLTWIGPAIAFILLVLVLERLRRDLNRVLETHNAAAT